MAGPLRVRGGGKGPAIKEKTFFVATYVKIIFNLSDIHIPFFGKDPI